MIRYNKSKYKNKIKLLTNDMNINEFYDRYRKYEDKKRKNILYIYTSKYMHKFIHI
jgi:hypothetical protein